MCGNVYVFLLKDVSLLVLVCVSPAQWPPVREHASKAGAPEAEGDAGSLRLVVVLVERKASHFDGVVGGFVLLTYME